MGTFVIKRIFWAIVILLLVSLIVFFMMQLLPGDPVRIAMGVDADPEAVEEMREAYGLNDPIIVQYFNWIIRAVQWDFGDSLLYQGRNITELINMRLPMTLWLGGFAVVIYVILGIFFGVVSAVKRSSWIDQIITLFANIGLGVPLFWIGVMFIFLFGLKWKLLPISGYVAPTESFSQFLYYGIAPILCMCVGLIPPITRQTRSNMLEVINQDYIRTARANGLPERHVIYRQALKNALIPVITIIGLQVRFIIGGTVIIERVFTIKGMGDLLITGILNRDYFIVQGTVLVICFITVAVNLLVDIAYGFIDPRIRKSWR